MGAEHGSPSFPPVEHKPIACDTMLQVEEPNNVQRVRVRLWLRGHPGHMRSRSGVENIHCALEDQRDGG
jgi:hypothetical protein